MNTQQVGTFQAKNKFSELLENAVQGIETVVTKHGKPIARIVPYCEEKPDRTKLLKKIEVLREEIAQNGPILKEGETWNDLAREGLR